MTLSQLRFYGGAVEQVLQVGVNRLAMQAGRVKALAAPNAGMAIDLPPANEVPLTTGGPVFYIINIGDESIDIRDFGGNVIDSVPIDSACIVMLADSSTANGRWHTRCREVGGKPFTTTTTTTTQQPITTTGLPTDITFSRTIGGGGSTLVTQSSTFRICADSDLMYITKELAWAMNPVMPSIRQHDVSLVLTTQNEGKDLEQTISSALAADRKPREIIVVDDCSHESVKQRLKGYPRTRVIQNDQCLGVGRSRAIGCSESKGDVVVVCDSHMLFPRSWLGRMLTHLEEHPDAVLCAASTTFLEGDGFFGTGARMVWTQHGWEAEWLAVRTDDVCPLVPVPLGACYMMRRETLDTVGGWGPGLRGWGCDEEYLAMRIWAMDLEVRVCLDVHVKHNYDRKIDRSTRDGLRPEQRHWEVLYNKQVMRQVLYWDGFPELRALLYEGYPELIDEVESRLSANSEEIQQVRLHLYNHRLLTQDGVAAKMQQVEADVAAFEVPPTERLMLQLESVGAAT